MSEINKIAGAAMLFGMLVGALLVWGVWCSNDSYRAGQIDAANGHQHYRLVKTPDGEQRWESDGK